MARKVLTVRDLEATAAGGEVVVPLDTIVTPLARDEAEARGITIRFEDAKPAGPGRRGNRARARRLRLAPITAASI